MTIQIILAYIYHNDTFMAAEERLNQALAAGFIPMAMLYRDNTGEYDISWRRLQGQWARPAMIKIGDQNENR